mmetsp:Transcript_21405/g.68362  ORF Transcript_21405/g.68362 Transcript_21405/m.68362 type:complete len:213 (+) Transcript_21405:598-1236(+)
MPLAADGRLYRRQMQVATARHSGGGELLQERRVRLGSSGAMPDRPSRPDGRCGRSDVESDRLLGGDLDPHAGSEGDLRVAALCRDEPRVLMRAARAGSLRPLQEGDLVLQLRLEAGAEVGALPPEVVDRVVVAVNRELAPQVEARRVAVREGDDVLLGELAPLEEGRQAPHDHVEVAISPMRVPEQIVREEATVRRLVLCNQPRPPLEESLE